MRRVPLTPWVWLAAMALCAGLSYWIAQRHLSPEQSTAVSPLRSRRPDAFANQVSITMLAPNGAAQYQMHAVKILHYEDDGRTEVHQPALRAFTPGQPDVTSTAKRGVINNRGSIIDLYKAARVMRAASRSEPEMEARSEHFRVFIDENRVQTDQPVQLRRGVSVVTANGMRYNHITRLIHLEGQVRGVIQTSDLAGKSKLSELPSR